MRVGLVCYISNNVQTINCIVLEQLVSDSFVTDYFLAKAALDGDSVEEDNRYKDVTQRVTVEYNENTTQKFDQFSGLPPIDEGLLYVHVDLFFKVDLNRLIRSIPTATYMCP